MREHAKTGSRLGRAVRTVVFCAVVLVLVLLLSVLLKPSPDRWDFDNIVDGFYDQPEDTVQVLFVGTSSAQLGYSPEELYDRGGICAYSLCIANQPVISSCQWVREAHRLHSESLEVVVLDPAAVLTPVIIDNCDICVGGMKLSQTKIESLREINALDPTYSVLEHAVPIFNYHSRWSELGHDDFYRSYEDAGDYTGRGQYLVPTTEVDVADASYYELPDWSVTDEVDAPVDELLAGIPSENLAALDSLSEFCKENGIQLVFSKVPSNYWNDRSHDTVTVLAERYGVPFIDFNLVELQERMSLYFPLDYYYNNHPNCYGAQKITGLLYDEVISGLGVADVRGDERWSFMEEDFAGYQAKMGDASLRRCQSLDDYLAALESGRFVVFAAGCGEVAGGMDAGFAEGFARIGLPGLSTLAPGCSYAGISDGCVNVAESIPADPSEKAVIVGSYRYGKLTIAPQVLGEDGSIPGAFELVGGGPLAGAAASLVLDGAVDAEHPVEELCDSCPGVNLVVYDRATGSLVDTAAFDVSTGDRTSDHVDPVYQERLNQARANAADAGLI